MHEARHGQPLSSELLLLVGAGEGTPVLPASGEQQRRPIGVVLADEASSVAAKPAAGSRWCFSDAVESDPAGRDFARSTDCCTLRWTPAKGRHATATREISRGRVLLRASAAAVANTAASGAATALLAESSGRDGAAASADAQRVGLDASTLALSLELLRSGREAAEEAAGSLLTHREHLSAAEAEAWERTAQRLRSAAASSGGSGCSCASGWSDEAVLRLLLAVHANAHPVLDDATASRTVGLGLFPAACLLNHSCAPTGVLSFEAGGKVLVVRALVDLRRGQEVTYSYLDEPHLFAPWRQRRALLRAAHRYEPSQPRSREESEAAALCRSRLPAAALGEPADENAARRPAPADCAYEARYEHLPERLAYASMRLIAAREQVMPLGTPGLATLYASHGSALVRLLRAGRFSAAGSAEALGQAEQSLAAACSIRASCLGDEHPLVAATARALADVRQRRRQRAGGAT
ncbi:hypothetical protein EMIHUDRAFT_454711 [Emiliania huxleyi CCMP1516]|uniref:SET domain-containing protein n=2 Tax=Emiliania huxleyi TaxID=2903 RepID=A0A0D3KRG7_EMIH1|nr:hypothetical protein EMIHUDRAFT_454711 [Emiliania huxleyi CCMP1516]EOD38352.1 hypothetical protein EMIHUDRAFT_454711 [Emiliania huxleyi CCMP1516]|eukprot:XP_005790781.1 hypothetical protein EMIHUDRAFT_454711 [Emiliania huxleyi CCMP1516]